MLLAVSLETGSSFVLGALESTFGVAGAAWEARVLGDDDWLSFGLEAGTDCMVQASAVDGDGALLIGGCFLNLSALQASRIAKWNGTQWTDIGSGMARNAPTWVSTIAVAEGDLYVGGELGSGGRNIARWDGTQWHYLDARLTAGFGEATVHAMAFLDDDLYIGGQFTHINDSQIEGVAKWDGTTWSALGSGLNGAVAALIVHQGELYVGGHFRLAGEIALNHVAKWNGTQWLPLGSGMNDWVVALASAGDQLYAGGFFSQADGGSANHVARWDGTRWHPCGTGVAGGVVHTLAVWKGELYVGGHFTAAGGMAAGRIARWDGNRWWPLGSGMDGGAVLTLSGSGSTLYAGGFFTSAGSERVSRVAQWDGTRWMPLASGSDGTTVNALAVSDHGVHLGGFFNEWFGSRPEPIRDALGGVGGGPVRAVLPVDDAVFVGGNFPADGVFSLEGFNGVIRWNGGSYSALHSGIVGRVDALTLYRGDPHAAGEFGLASGSGAWSIARWDGGLWRPLGDGLRRNGGLLARVRTLAVSGTNLVAAGEFDQAGVRPANRIAKWDGTEWSALGTGLNGEVWALAVAGQNIFAGGEFSTAGGIDALRVAQWDGARWWPLSSGIEGGAVLALEVAGDDLFAGGAFTSAGGIMASRIARWNGAQWTSLGSGIQGGDVHALAADDFHLWVGGNFTTAGGRVSPKLAQLRLRDPLPTIYFQAIPVRDGHLNIRATGPADKIAILDASTNLQDWAPQATNVLEGGEWPIFLPISTGQAQFLRLRITTSR